MSEDQLVSWRLKQLESRLSSMDEKLDAMSTEMAGWKGRASAWGVIGGAIMAILTTIAAKLLVKQ